MTSGGDEVTFISRISAGGKPDQNNLALPQAGFYRELQRTQQATTGSGDFDHKRRCSATANAVYSQPPAAGASRHRQQQQDGLPRHQGQDPGRAGGQHGQVQGEGGPGGEHGLLVRHNCQGLHADE